MKFGKRQLVLSALILALGAAVYLNWQFSDNKSLITTNSIDNENKHLGEAKYVNNYIEPSNADNEDTQQNKDYFSQAQLNRTKARDEALEKAKNALNDLNSSDEIKSEALKIISKITDNIQRESNIENLLKAKGFNDIMVMIQNDECSIIISNKKLDENDAVIIKDVIVGQTGLTCDNIKIIESDQSNNWNIINF